MDILRQSFGVKYDNLIQTKCQNVSTCVAHDHMTSGVGSEKESERERERKREKE
jgi:hypothetical protein